MSEIYEDPYNYEADYDEPEYFSDDSPPGLPTAQALGQEAAEAGLAPSIDMWRALEDEQREYDSWREQRQAELQYADYVEQRQALEQAEEVGNELVADAARRHGVPQRDVDEGLVYDTADALLNAAQWESYNAGDVEGLAVLRSPEGAKAAIEAAAMHARVQNFAANAWSHGSQRPTGMDPAAWHAHLQRTRADFEAMERRK